MSGTIPFHSRMHSRSGYISIYRSLSLYIYIYTCIYIYIHIYTHTYIYIYTHTHIYTYIYIPTYQPNYLQIIKLQLSGWMLIKASDETKARTAKSCPWRSGTTPFHSRLHSTSILCIHRQLNPSISRFIVAAATELRSRAQADRYLAPDRQPLPHCQRE